MQKTKHIEIGSNDTVVACILHQRLAQSRFAGYSPAHAGVIQLHSKDGSWSSRRMVVSLGGSNGSTTHSAGMRPVDEDQLNAALIVAEFYLQNPQLKGINDAVAAQFSHNVTDEEGFDLLEEARA